MDVSAHDVRNARFSGTRHVYDRREVDEFLERLGASLEQYEQELTISRRKLDSLEHALEVAKAQDVREPESEPGAIEELERKVEDLRVDALAEAARIRREAEEEARRIADEARRLAGSPDAATPALDDDEPRRWRERLAAEMAADTFVATAREEARRILQITDQQVVEGTAAADRDRAAALDEVQREVTSIRDAAGREANRVVGEARVDGDRIVEEARRAATQMTDAAERDVRSLERRVRQIRSSLRDLERRFSTLTANTLAEFSMLGDLIDLDVREPLPDVLASDAVEPGETDQTTGQGFYERRLAGLRSRLEATKDEQGRV